MRCRALCVALVLVAASACSLSPQPLPPGDTASRTSDAGGGPSPGTNGDATGSDASAAQDAGERDPKDAASDVPAVPPNGGIDGGGDAGDGASDAPSDAPSDGARSAD